MIRTIGEMAAKSEGKMEVVHTLPPTFVQPAGVGQSRR